MRLKKTNQLPLYFLPLSFFVFIFGGVVLFVFVYCGAPLHDWNVIYLDAVVKCVQKQTGVERKVRESYCNSIFGSEINIF